jgi:hypothetical protein
MYPVASAGDMSPAVAAGGMYPAVAVGGKIPAAVAEGKYPAAAVAEGRIPAVEGKKASAGCSPAGRQLQLKLGEEAF